MEVYKVIEERLSPSGKIEYLTLPLYQMLSVDEISGRIKLKSKPYVQDPNKQGIHSFATLDDAKEWIETYFIGYTMVRPVIYLCKIDEAKSNGKDHLIVSDEIQFLKPILQFVGGKFSNYEMMVMQEKKKKQFGIVYDESEITGDVDIQKDI